MLGMKKYKTVKNRKFKSVINARNEKMQKLPIILNIQKLQENLNPHASISKIVTIPAQLQPKYETTKHNFSPASNMDEYPFELKCQIRASVSVVGQRDQFDTF